MGDEQDAAHIIGVTGATGAVGGRVARRLARRGASQRLVVRDLNRAPELAGASAAMAVYEDPAAFERAVRGADTLFLVSAGEDPERVQHHIGAVDAAIAAGVTRIVYLSFLAAGPAATFTFARDHFFTEAHIRSTDVAHTFLRPSLYLDLVPRWADESGLIRGPAGQGRVAWVSRDDIADVATTVLLGGREHDGRTYDITGPEAVTLGQTVDRLSALTGKPLRYLPETWEEALESRRRVGAPEWAVEGWASSYAAIARGELDVVSPAVSDLTGHPPQSIEGFIRRNPSACAHIHA
ncbi:SDR family oxidoreductase [Marinitenerispora sediminis]|uniref:NAD(P)-dependent oxidoreductase n=1 Tax=Marinitenerispora sediminis TaxID=1931232 RepID=A0A368TCE2_9ACTN|nr:SDR family oxidoreductase [Marinitenerispora sediminis]RCV55272.1 NAD(P)-dependent oxidoreductase [Marinitenerispora sediminis]RCV61624.1 NAD(P)-dependent oxidoreductase [Marinitenerispora sediminis]RCV62646.1 NAD(P)-dependent oxidoreductase [Marinitenerispora sediminis]